MEKNYWTDTHCHLDMLQEKIPSVLKRAVQKEVSRIITIATDKKSSEKVCQICKELFLAVKKQITILFRLERL